MVTINKIITLNSEHHKTSY